MLAVITYMIICVGSVFLVYNLMNDSNSKHLNNALIMLAVGTLIGDAMLHLLPKVSHTCHSTGLFPYSLKTSENLWFSNIFRGFRKRSPVT